MMRSMRGLTLIELMIVVAVLVILSSVAYPLYTNQVIKARRTDGRAALAAIALAQERYFTANGFYAADLSDLSELDAKLQQGDSLDGYYKITQNRTTTSFTLTATPTGSQAKDTDCTTMTINQAGVKSGTGSDVGKCW